MTISSSTFDTKILKEIREHASEWEGAHGNMVHLPSSLNIELERLEMRDVRDHINDA
jgi:hypothetical protein